MSKLSLLFRGPVETRSGYGSHSRDLLKSLRDMDVFDIKIDSCDWGSTPKNILSDEDEFHEWIKLNIVNRFSGTPDLYIEVTVPNEFKRVGKVNIGITAGIETTVAPKNWIDGCNQMDLVITTSKFSKEILIQTVYNETEKLTGKLVRQHKIERPIEVLFEGLDTKIFNNEGGDFDLNIKEDFAYLFVGHWLNGPIGQDRKDVGMLIKCFLRAFEDVEDAPALILKTSSATFSVTQREMLRKKIEDISEGIKNPPSVYLLFGDLTDEEMNSLYNHPKVKSMVSLTKGEGFGRPLLEFSLTGKPIIASNWSGHKDFLPMDKSILIGGKLTEVDESVTNDFILKGSKWFTANYNEASEVLKVVKNDYENFKKNSEKLMEDNKEKFSLEKMTDRFKEILLPYIAEKPKRVELNLPKLSKIKP
jgi:glycosyltransferase involved in cell wall biosynthesis